MTENHFDRDYLRSTVKPEILEQYAVRPVEPRSGLLPHAGGWQVYFKGETHGPRYADRLEAEDAALYDAWLRSLDPVNHEQ